MRPRSNEADDSLRSLSESLETTLGLALPKVMRRIAIRFTNGERLSQIAVAEAIGVSTVKDYLGYVARTLHCGPLCLEIAKPKTSGPSSASTGQLNSAQLMTKAKCESCKKTIEADEERILVAPMALKYHMEEEDWGNHRIIPYLSPGTIHYCLECARSTEEFRMSNPWFMTDDERAEMDDWIESNTHPDADNGASDTALVKAWAIGDLHALDSVIPTKAKRGDIMERALPMSSVAAGIAGRKHGEDSSSAAEIADQLFSRDEGWKRVEAAQVSASGEAGQRTKLRDYLKLPESRGKLLPAVRAAATLWANGLNQKEVAQKLGADQSTVSRRIKAAMAMANARR